MPRLSATSSATASENSGDEAAAPAAAGGSSVDTTTTTTSTSAPPPCPTGGPGGPRCCSRCSTSYARILFNKTKAAETATIAEVGHEVAQLEEMLRDAQMRLRLAVDVSKENEARRGAV
mmetsp:Transcript_20461/g.58723  ORF Transcript_20461/g.58723 Transcript_20461/m.58723 type:complete len:119 (-) Transcript_20461:20-376(-)